MSSTGKNRQPTKKLPRRRVIVSDTPEELPEAIVWLQKLVTTIYSMNLEGIMRLKDQFDQIYDDHVDEFDRKLRRIDFKKADEVQGHSEAKVVLGYLLAVCKYLERLVEIKKQSQQSSSRKQESDSLANALQKDLTKELQAFSRELEQAHGIKPK
ncbi:MAG: hypothetical protein ACFE8O_06640 [Candidatus Hermodarchaeota archaeon]